MTHFDDRDKSNFSNETINLLSEWTVRRLDTARRPTDDASGSRSSSTTPRICPTVISYQEIKLRNSLNINLKSFK